MKLKKLLAGVLSATMVATMIPASMAFSSVSAVAPDGVVTDGLVSYFTFDGDGTNSVDGATTASFLAEGNASAASIVEDSVRGQVVQIGGANGNRSYVDLGNDIPDSAEGVSFGGWVKLAEGQDAAAWWNMFTLDDNKIDSWHYFTASTNGTMHQNFGAIFDGVGNPCLANDGAWHYLVLASSGQDINVYVDGSLIYTYVSAAKALSTLVKEPDVHFYLGYIRQFWDAANCYIDDYAIYSKELTAEEVKANYDATVVAVESDVTSGLISAYPLADDYDDLLGGDAVTTMGTTAGFNIYGGVDAAVVSTSGANTDGLKIPSSAFANATSSTGLTVSVDLYADTFNFWSRAFQFGTYPGGNWDTSATDTSSQLYLAEGGSICAHINNTQMVWFDGTYSDSGANDACVEDQWVNVTMVFDSTSIYYYVDGALMTIAGSYDEDHNYTVADVINAIVNGSDNWIGRSYWSADTAMVGGAANLITYNRALSPNDVKALAAADGAEEVYAQSIADSLDLQVIGMQKGYLGDDTSNTAIRMVANMNKDATDANADSIVSVGWAWQTEDNATADTTITQMANNSYGTVRVTTVSSDPSLTTADKVGTVYGYTLAAASASTAPSTYYAAVPYAVIEVGGAEFLFCYDGKGASYLSSSSNVVLAPTTFAEANVA